MRPTTPLAALAVLACTATLGACGVGGPSAGSEADYPDQDVRVVVPYAAGGPTDLAGRAAAECLGEELGQPFVVENVEGGAGAMGMSEMVNAKADGYTLAIGTVGNVVVAPLVGEGVQYDADDVVPVGKIYEMPSALVLPADSEYSSVEDLIKAAEEAPGEITIATPGAASLYQVALQSLADDHDVEFRLVPFDGGAPAVTAFLGGNVDAMFLEASEQVRGLESSGKATIVATGSPEPVDFLPDAPTLASLGYDDLPDTSAFFTLVAPAETPESVLDTLGDTLEACLSDDAVVDKLSADYVPDEFVDADAVQAEFDEAGELYADIF